MYEQYILNRRSISPVRGDLSARSRKIKDSQSHIFYEPTHYSPLPKHHQTKQAYDPKARQLYMAQTHILPAYSNQFEKVEYSLKSRSPVNENPNMQIKQNNQNFSDLFDRQLGSPTKINSYMKQHQDKVVKNQSPKRNSEMTKQITSVQSKISQSAKNSYRLWATQSSTSGIKLINYEINMLIKDYSLHSSNLTTPKTELDTVASNFQTMRTRRTTAPIKELQKRHKLRLQSLARVFPKDQTHKENIAIKKIFTRSVRRLIIVNSFFDSLSKYSQEQLKARIEYRKSWQRAILPFYPDDPFVLIWRTINTFMMFASAIIYPYYVCLSNTQNIEPVIDLFSFYYAIDIVINLLTAFVDDNANLHITYGKIFIFYLKSWLFFDIFSIIPFSLFTTNKAWCFLNWFRILKYFLHKQQRNYKGQLFNQQVNDSLIKTNSLVIPRNFTFLGIVIVNCLLLTHIFACLQQYIYNQNYDYVIDYYWAAETITIVGFGDIDQNFTLTSIWMLIGVGYYSLTIGNFAKLLNIYIMTNDREHGMFQIEQLSFYTNMPDKLKHQIQEFLILNYQNNPFFPRESRIMLSELPFSIYIFMVMSSMQNAFQGIPFLLQDINNTAELLANSKLAVIQPGKVIYRYGQYSNEVFYLVSGDVRIMSQNKYTLLNILEGTIFGDFECLDETIRLTYGVAMKRSMILIIPKRKLLNKMRTSSILNFELRQLHARRKQLIHSALQKEKVDRKKLRRCDLKILSDDDIKMTPEDYNAQRKTRILQSQYIYNRIFLRKLLGKQREKLEKFLVKFRRSVNRVIDLNRQLTYTPPEDWKDLNEYQVIRRIFSQNVLKDKNFFMSSRKSSILLPSENKKFQQMMSNYSTTRVAEIKLKRILLLHKKYARERIDKIKLANVIQRFNDDPQFLEKETKIKLYQSQYVDRVPIKEEEIKLTQEYIEIKTTLESKLDRITRLWTRGSIEKFELYQILHDNGK